MDSKNEKDVIPMGKAVAIILIIIIGCVSLAGFGAFFLINQATRSNQSVQTSTTNIFGGVLPSRELRGVFISERDIQHIEFMSNNTVAFFGFRTESAISGTYELNGNLATVRVSHGGTDHLIEFSFDESKSSFMAMGSVAGIGNERFTLIESTRTISGQYLGIRERGAGQPWFSEGMYEFFDNGVVEFTDDVNFDRLVHLQTGEEVVALTSYGSPEWSANYAIMGSRVIMLYNNRPVESYTLNEDGLILRRDGVTPGQWVRFVKYVGTESILHHSDLTTNEQQTLPQITGHRWDDYFFDFTEALRDLLVSDEGISYSEARVFLYDIDSNGIPDVVVRPSLMVYEEFHLLRFVDGRYLHVGSIGTGYDANFYTDSLGQSVVVFDSDGGSSVYSLEFLESFFVAIEHLGWIWWRHYPDDHIIPFDGDTLVPLPRMTELETLLGIEH